MIPPALPLPDCSVSTLTWENVSLPVAIERAAEAGFDAVDIGLQPFTDLNVRVLHRDGLALLKPVIAALERYRMEVITLNAGIHYAEPGFSLATQADTLAAAARALGASGGVTVPAPPRSGNTAASAVDQVAELLGAFRKRAVILMLETYLDQWTDRIDDTRALCDRFPDLRLTLDPSHYFVQGLLPADWEKLMPRVSHVHLRACGRNGRGEVQTAVEAMAPEVLQSLRELIADPRVQSAGFEFIGGFNNVDAPSETAKLRALLGASDREREVEEVGN